MKNLLFLIVAMVLVGCCEKPAVSKKTGMRYFPVKICAVGDLVGDSCVEYAAKCFSWGGDYLRIVTVDGHKYNFNVAGWSIIITEK